MLKKGLIFSRGNIPTCCSHPFNLGCRNIFVKMYTNSYKMTEGIFDAGCTENLIHKVMSLRSYCSFTF